MKHYMHFAAALNFAARPASARRRRAGLVRRSEEKLNAETQRRRGGNEEWDRDWEQR
ncbi:MAG: hypothetical protein JWM97_1065 [Phycisphaerales bacterium]|nr:hypothetical protein [Phycisphaerales bacterium]